MQASQATFLCKVGRLSQAEKLWTLTSFWKRKSKESVRVNKDVAPSKSTKYDRLFYTCEYVGSINWTPGVIFLTNKMRIQNWEGKEVVGGPRGIVMGRSKE